LHVFPVRGNWKIAGSWARNGSQSIVLYTGNGYDAVTTPEQSVQIGGMLEA
jgi:hypothetical protein